ncbi:MAG: molybdopterin-dependent oxidoreductase [Nakamurella sp.]
MSKWWAPVAGLIVVVVAFAATELLAALGVWAGLFSPAAAPITSLANTFIVLTPEWLKEFAIAQFGTNDKVALEVGMYVTIAIAALVIGFIAARWTKIALAAVVVLAVVVAIAVITRANATIFDLLPLAIGIALALVVFSKFFPARWTATDAPAKPGVPDRRQFFRSAGLTAAGAVVAGGLSKVVPTGAAAIQSRSEIVLPKAAKPYVVPAGSSLDVQGITGLVTPNKDFYRIDTSFQPPIINPGTWSMQIKGMVDNPMTLTYADISAREMVEAPITLTCVSNEVGGTLVGNAVWLGTPIRTVLQEAGVQQGADCVLCTDINGFTLSAPLEALTDDRQALFAIGMNGEPLPFEHGFPVRMVVPGLYGFVSATKWIASMELTTFSKVSAYWTQRGWSDHGPIKLSSRIDTPAGFASFAAGESVVIGGMAWAQNTGVAKVEVQVDDEPWAEAMLSKPLSKDSWVQWKYTWKAAGSGPRTLRVRATDAAGKVQTDQRADPIPDGSSGWNSRTITIT